MATVIKTKANLIQALGKKDNAIIVEETLARKIIRSQPDGGLKGFVFIEFMTWSNRANSSQCH